MGVRPLLGRMPALAVLGGAVVLQLGACSGTSMPAVSSPASTSAVVSSSPSPPPSSDPTTKARDDVLAVYRAYWAAQVKAQAAPESKAVGDLSRYSVDQALADVRATVLLFRQQGIVMRGEPALSPSLTSIQTADPAKATITDCVDSSHWTPVYKATGKSALAPNQPPRVVMDSTAMIYNGHWVIRTSVAHRDRTC
jgi:hypothetical protein